MSLSGKTMPQSTRIMSPWHSYSVVFLPTSPGRPGDNLHRHSAFPRRARACAAGHSRAACACPRQTAPPRPRLHLPPGLPALPFSPLCAARSGGRLALLVWCARRGAACAQGPGPCRGAFSAFSFIFSSMFRTLRAMRAARLAPAGTKRRRPEAVFAKKTRSGPAWLPCAVASAGPAMRPGCCKLMYCFVSCP